MSNDKFTLDIVSKISLNNLELFTEPNSPIKNKLKYKPEKVYSGSKKRKLENSGVNFHHHRTSSE